MTEDRVCWALKDTEDTIELVLLHSPHFAFHKQPTCVPPWISRIIHDIVCFVWDASLTVINIITPKKKQGYVVADGCPSFGGQWPEYAAPTNNVG